MPMRLISRVLGEPLDVVTAAIQETRDSVLLHLSHWENDDDKIEVVQTHEVTWNILREMFIKTPSSGKKGFYFIVLAHISFLHRR